ncbi:ROK family transcriptional regulator [Conexibacter woesei]|uniref:ROK family protein n=1 Tax=Conexibacter woesei (strain DSM 14684 / CCUG 47730 / CIP 108061 / JCM 11494 / NBRC 100937 / ID131577) TaxID=469383 RepID=D3FEL5_CONWI|nr:ROK family transcriptional regulator [Conexibacter woesei]ADB49689.1 ROK family protein [Conexibacter woesei DSM 14684]
MEDRTQRRVNARQTNRFKVLRALYEHPGSTRTELAADTGLSRPTVSTVTDELVQAGIVAQHEDTQPRTGRPPVLLSLASGAAYAVGLDMGHAHVQVAVSDLSGQILGHERSAADVDHAPVESFDLAGELVHGALGQAGVPLDRVIGVGMALAAPVDRATGTVFADGILPSWGRVQPAIEMEARLDLPVMVHNDANLGALGEHVFGAGRDVAEMMYVRLSAGLGLGLVLGGRPYGGTSGVAGELGHVRVAPEGLICRCGNRGCLETVASSTAVARLLAHSRDEPVSVERLLELVADGDRGARRAVAEAGKTVGEALATVVNLFNPELIIVGGDLAAGGDALLAPLRTAIDEYAVAPAAGAVTVSLGALGDKAEVLGAVALVLGESPAVLATGAASVGS